MTTLKFQPGSFVELDDLNGGRRVAIVCRDGISCMDSMNVELSTPLFFHPVFAVKGLGTMMAFVQQYKLHGVLALLGEQKAGEPPLDALLLMQRLWCLWRMGVNNDNMPTLEQLADSRVQTGLMRERAEEVHRYAAHYHAPQTGGAVR